ncbi:DUF1289 domain-containing protein [Trinickia diaoshuihuensis]|uniref:DUF1289 domain-containing protein n=1 Tax=Trinickia diaoshuihuensis TaxID=2292265 RepID=UPI000E26C1DB|nr:DUF1289 domain-containing protein [Trinickia diaoshuihuensis]
MQNEEVGNRNQDLADAIAAARVLTPVGSPCIDVCRLNQVSGYCEGCLRTRAEIKAWKSSSDEDKLAMLERLAVRNRERG